MKRWIAVIALAGTLTSGMAEANDGNALLKGCRLMLQVIDGGKISPSQLLSVGYCMGLTEGVSSTMILNSDELIPKSRICFPSTGISNEQAARIVVKYLDLIPEHLNEDATFLTLIAFEKAYPCK